MIPRAPNGPTSNGPTDPTLSFLSQITKVKLNERLLVGSAVVGCPLVRVRFRQSFGDRVCSPHALLSLKHMFADREAHTHCHFDMFDLLRLAYGSYWRCSFTSCTMIMRDYWYQPLLQAERDAHTLINILMWQT